MKRIFVALVAVGMLLARAGSAEPDAVKAFCIDFNWGPGGENGFAPPGLWAGAEPAEHVAWYEGLGVNTIQTFAVSCNGYAWYKGDVVPQQPGLKHDFLTEMVRLGHERGMRVMGYFCVGANTRWSKAHPEQSYGAGSDHNLIMTDEYLDFLAASIQDAVRTTGMDGFMIDWLWNPTRVRERLKCPWKDAEKELYAQVMGKRFPGEKKLSEEDELAFYRKNIDRTWQRIHDAAREANPDCIIWLSCYDLEKPSVKGTRLLAEVDWLMNEAPDTKALGGVLEARRGKNQRLIQCLVGWGDQHNAYAVVTNPDVPARDFYGFAKPGDNSLPLPIAEYRRNPIGHFRGNDRNIATLARFYTGRLGGEPSPREPLHSVEANWTSLDARTMPPWFEDARFGVFIVWGPYCVPAWAPKGQYAEWYGNRMNREGSPTQKFHREHYGEDLEYKQFGDMMKAELWNPDEWIDLFVRSGARYVVTTANYHDGFCLWPSSYSPGWNAMDVGPRRDVLGELFHAGRKRGLIMGIYYSLYEWYHPLWLSDRDRFVAEHFHPQFKEVISKYQPSLVFADGEWEADYTLWRSEELLTWLFNESPVCDEIVVNDRWGKCRGEHGSWYESEYGGGTMGPGHPWQEDRGMGKSYGYNRNEGIGDYDSAESMIRMLTRCAGNGGNYLITVGPTADGRIPVIMQQRLLEIGEWLKKNGQAIYESEASPFWPRKLAWGTCTRKPGRIYAHVWDVSAEEILLPGLKNDVTKCVVLSEPARVLETRRTERGWVVAVPEVVRKDTVPVVRVDIAGEPDVDFTIQPSEGGALNVTAIEAEIHGMTPEYIARAGQEQIGCWGDPEDYVSWPVRIAKPGMYDVSVTYSCAKGAAGSRFEVRLAGKTLTGQTHETGSWDDYTAFELGSLKVNEPGDFELEVHPLAKPKWRSMGLQRITLRLKP